MEPLITVVVPVYNGEKFIDRALNSLINQTIHNFEVICVDDGSKDNSPAILDDYASKYDYFKVIHQENAGAAIARNNALDLVESKYVMFLDADDYYELNAIEVVTDRIEKYNPDMLDFGFHYVDNFGCCNPVNHKLPKEYLLDKSVITERIIPHLINVKKDDEAFIFDFAWNKVFKMDVIKNNDVRFPSNRKTWEDRVFLVLFLKHIKSYFCIKDCLHYYVYVDNCLSTRYDLQFFDIILDNYHIYYDIYHDTYDFNTDYVNQYWSNSIQNMIMRSLKEKNNTDKIYQNISRVLKEELVIQWFSNRKMNSPFDQKVNELVLNHDVDQLIKMYKKILRKQDLKEKYNSLKYKLYRMIKG